MNHTDNTVLDITAILVYLICVAIGIACILSWLYYVPLYLGSGQPRLVLLATILPLVGLILSKCCMTIILDAIYDYQVKNRSPYERDVISGADGQHDKRLKSDLRWLEVGKENSNVQ